MMENKSITVLVVDDDEDFLLQQKIGLESAGFRVISAGGVNEATEVLQQNRPNIAVIDLIMEEADGGFALSREIKQKYPECPVIICTSVTTETGMKFDTSAQGEDSWIKADAMLDKPVRMEQLLKEIERLLG